MSAAGVAWVHGYTMHSGIWAQVWSALPDREHVGIDLPGHGTQAGMPMPRTLDGWADRVADQLRDSGARDLVGLSFGSAIALQVAARHPELIDRLVLAAPTLSGAPEDREARAKYFLLMMRLRELGPGPALARVWMNDPPPIFRGLRAHPARYAAMEQIVATHPFTELRTGAMRALSQTVQGPDLLASIRCPILLIVGDEDMPQFVENARTIARYAADVTTEVRPGLGHLPLLEDPAGCAPALAGFLAAPVAAS